MIRRLFKILKFSLILILITSWIFSGWPRLWQNPRIPPGVQVVQATASTPTIAGTGTDDAAVGTVTWATPEEITVTGGGDDSVYATAALGKNAVSHYLKATNFGFTIPDGSTILGITVEIDRKEGTAANGGVKDTEVKLIDEAGTIRSTNKADTVNGWGSTEAIATYGSISDTWGEATGFWTTAKINDLDFGVALSAIDYKVSGGGAAEDAFVDFIRITIEYGPPSITVGTIGTQTASMNIPSTGQYVGGAFTMVRSGGSANVTSITITENGTVDALNNLDNIKLQYDLDITSPYDCAGESYAAGDTQYGSTDIDGFSAANGTSTFTGSVAVSNTQAMCVYVVLDVGSGASDAQTLEIEITNPSTDVVVSAGDVTPATAVAISGATTLNLLPNVFQDHYRWRNDDGAEASGGTASVGIIRPDGDSSVAWVSVTPAGTHFSAIDDVVTQPSAGDTGDFIQDNAANVDDFTMENPAGGTTYSAVDVWVYALTAGNEKVNVNLVIGGTPQTGQDVTLNTSFAWYQVSFTGLSMSQADADGLIVRLTQVKAGGQSNVDVATMYAEVFRDVPAATWAQVEDAAHTGLAKSANIRLRFQVDNTGGSASAYNYRLEWAAQSGTCDTAYSGESYAAVPDTATTEHFDMVTSAESLFVDGNPTTAQLTADALSFIAGDQVESPSNQSGAITLAQNQYTEVEYVFQANTNATDGGVYCFRVTNAGTALNSADVIAQVTLAGGGGGPTISCSTDISSTAFGAWTDTSIKTASPNASTTMSCSGTSAGCTLYVKDAGSGSNPGLWKSVSPTYLIASADATLSAGVDGYGIQATSTASGSGGALSFNSKYNKTGNDVGGLIRTNTLLASSTVDISGREAVVTHKAAISETTFSGSYADTITYECVVN